MELALRLLRGGGARCGLAREPGARSYRPASHASNLKKQRRTRGVLGAFSRAREYRLTRFQSKLSQQATRKCPSHQRWYSIADLAEAIPHGPRELEGVREGLQSCCLSHRDHPSL